MRKLDTWLNALAAGSDWQAASLVCIFIVLTFIAATGAGAVLSAFNL